MTEAIPQHPLTLEPHQQPRWAPLTLVAFVALVVATNVAAITWGKLLPTHPTPLLALSSRNRYLALALGADVSPLAYWTIGFARVAVAFVVCHLIGRAYADRALGWFVKYLGVTQDALDSFNRGFGKAEWAIVPFFAGSNLVAALSGIHRTPPRRLAALLTVGILGRLALIWWLAHVFDQQLTEFLSWVQRYSWWAVGASIVAVVAMNMRNFRGGADR